MTDEAYRTLADRIVNGVDATPSARSMPAGPDGLTRRQYQILAMLANDMSREDVADNLGLKPGSIRSHMQVAYRTLGVKTLVGAMTRMNWLTPPDVPAGSDE